MAIRHIIGPILSVHSDSWLLERTAVRSRRLEDIARRYDLLPAAVYCYKGRYNTVATLYPRCFIVACWRSVWQCDGGVSNNCTPPPPLPHDTSQPSCHHHKIHPHNENLYITWYQHEISRGIYHVVSITWYLARGIYHVVSITWYLSRGIYHVISVTWYLSRDICHVTHNTCSEDWWCFTQHQI